jgi:hypothetical protein
LTSGCRPCVTSIWALSTRCTKAQLPQV